MRAAGSHGSAIVKEEREEAEAEQEEEALFVEIGHVGTEAGPKHQELSLSLAHGSSLAQQHQQQISEQVAGAGAASDVNNAADAAAAAASNPERPKSLSLGSSNSFLWSKVREKVVQGELQSALAKRPVSGSARLACAAAV